MVEQLIRRLVLVLGLLGAVVFGSAWLVAMREPARVEPVLRELIRHELQQRVDAQLDRLPPAARELATPAVDRAIHSLGQADCDCGGRLGQWASKLLADRVAWQHQMRARITQLVKDAYVSVASQLLREFRIFTASNAVAFALLALAAGWRKGASLQLLLPSLVLLGAILVVGGFYLFAQDWLHTIVFGDYLGLGYAAWLATVALLLADILLNRARVTTQLINVSANALGAAVQVAPC